MLSFFIFLRKKKCKSFCAKLKHDKEKETVPPRVYIEERKELSFANAKKKKKTVATGGTCDLSTVARYSYYLLLLYGQEQIPTSNFQIIILVLLSRVL